MSGLVFGQEIKDTNTLLCNLDSSFGLVSFIYFCGRDIKLEAIKHIDREKMQNRQQSRKVIKPNRIVHKEKSKSSTYDNL